MPSNYSNYSFELWRNYKKIRDFDPYSTQYTDFDLNQRNSIYTDRHTESAIFNLENTTKNSSIFIVQKNDIGKLRDHILFQ